MRHPWLLALALLTLGGHAPAQAEPPPGGYNDITRVAQAPARKAILDACRAKAAQVFGEQVKFKVRYVGTEGNWAIALLEPRQANGEAFAWGAAMANGRGKSRSEPAWLNALLVSQGGTWVAKDLAPEPSDGSDSPLDAWPKQHKALPRNLYEFAALASNCSPCGPK